jgi:hypothetical protein
MKNAHKFVAVALMAAGLGFAAVPKASACGSCMQHSAVIDSSLVAPVIDTTLTQPAIIDRSVGMPVNNVIMRRPAYDDFYGTPVRSHLLGVDTPFFGLHLF